MPCWNHDRAIGLWGIARAGIRYVRKHTDGVSEIILRCESLAAGRFGEKCSTRRCLLQFEGLDSY